MTAPNTDCSFLFRFNNESFNSLQLRYVNSLNWIGCSVSFSVSLSLVERINDLILSGYLLYSLIISLNKSVFEDVSSLILDSIHVIKLSFQCRTRKVKHLEKVVCPNIISALRTSPLE